MRLCSIHEALNPHMYDLSTPEGRRWYEEDLVEFERLKAQQRPKEVKREHKHDNIKLTLWRGCSREWLDICASKSGNKILLNGSNSRSKVIWFAHNLQKFIAGVNPYQNALDHSDGILITHYLQCLAHYDIVTYDDGTVSEEINEEAASKTNRFSEARCAIFGSRVIEPPDGWWFSEHLEKHLLCNIVLIDPSQISYS